MSASPEIKMYLAGQPGQQQVSVSMTCKSYLIQVGGVVTFDAATPARLVQVGMTSRFNLRRCAHFWLQTPSGNWVCLEHVVSLFCHLLSCRLENQVLDQLGLMGPLVVNWMLSGLITTGLNTALGASWCRGWAPLSSCVILCRTLHWVHLGVRVEHCRLVVAA